MMYAIADVFPLFKNAREWTVGIDDGLAELKPTRQEHEDIITEGGRISRMLKRQLKSDEPDMSDNETGQITQPIYYDDGDVIHVCESAIMDRGVRLVWTKCDMDVPDDQGFTAEGEAPAINLHASTPWREDKRNEQARPPIRNRHR